LIAALALATVKSSENSEKFSDEDVKSLAGKLDELSKSKDLTENERALLLHLIAGAESLFTRPIQEEEVIVAEKEIREATISALTPFVNSNKGKKQDVYFWVRRTTMAPK
jgi:ribonuclease HII